MNKWDHAIANHARKDIDEAVANEYWQRFRLSLKGIPTGMKLDMLNVYLENSINDDNLTAMGKRTRSVQVDNYINALKRGGQLDLEGNVVR